MAKQTVVLNKSFTADTQITSANLALVMSGTNSGNVMLPGAAGATKFIGVSWEPSASATDSTKPNTLDVQVLGIAQIQSDGSATIAAGDYLIIANSSGQVKTQAPGFGGATVESVVGMALNAVAATAGLLVDVLLMPSLIKP